MNGYDDEAVERLAEQEHIQWCTWAQNVMDTEQGLSTDRRERWRSLMVPYAELSEEMKEYDRIWAREALDCLAAAPRTSKDAL